MVPRDQADNSDEPLTCGIRLARLNWPKPSGLGRGEAFIHFLTLFMNIDFEEGENYLTYPLTRKENVLPFVNSFTDPNPSIQAVLDEYWSKILTVRLLPVGLPGELNVALKRKVVSYSPQFVARQFELAQALPAPTLPDTGDQLMHYEVDDTGKLERLLDRNHKRMEDQSNRQSFPEIVRCWLCTQSFATWWSKYFTTHTRHIGSGFSNMKLPTKTKDKTPSPTPDRQQIRGKAIASGTRKRSIRGHSRGLSSSKALKIGETSLTPATTRVLRPRQVRTPFSNRESSPIDADEENEEGQEIPSEALLTPPTFEAEAPSPTEHAHFEPQEQSLNLLLSQAKQVYSSGGKVPLGGGVDSKETAEPEAVRGVPPVPATLSKIAARIISLLGFPLEDLATNDKLKADLISAINVLDDELLVSEADLTHQFRDFVSGLYSSDLLALADRKKELDVVVDGWKLLCRRAVNCSEAISQISQVLEQGKKSEQKAVARIKALEDELAVVKEDLANIRSANDDLSNKLKHYEGNKASLASTASKAESDMGKARASYNAAEKKVEAFDQLCAHLKLSLGRFI
ncbi:hypothetical protein PIB30_051626 [Stylosanthes scabra]|uniref:Uncharacterized protein n=1 Tax=Stylosanthes scabra TaxID=79078 RepID=A0ABU6TIV7_9FABA|nr:hypothetical protein [Stylosanthes scabra]